MSPMLVFLAAVALCFAVLAAGALRLAGRTRATGWPVRLIGGAGLVALSAALVTWATSERTLRTRLEVPLPELAVPSDSASLARGAHLATVLGCTSCHGPDLGGRVFFDEPGVARLAAPNLTSGEGGRGAEYSDAELARTLRSGVRRNGELLFVMPTAELSSLADADLAAVIAHLRRVPPVARSTPPREIQWLGRFGIATGQYRPSRDYLPSATSRPAAPPSGATVEHGRYLAHAICSECHETEGTVTRVAPGAPPHMDVLGGYEVAGLTRAVREGIAQDGRQLDTTMMRPARVGALSDEEIAALQLYFRARLARTTGGS